MLSGWAVFLLVWGVFAFRVKRDVRRGGFASVWSSAWPLRLLLALFLLAAAFRVEARAHSRPTSVGSKAALFVPPAALGWSAAAIVVIGISFAIWARVVL